MFKQPQKTKEKLSPERKFWLFAKSKFVKFWDMFIVKHSPQFLDNLFQMMLSKFKFRFKQTLLTFTFFGVKSHNICCYVAFYFFQKMKELKKVQKRKIRNH